MFNALLTKAIELLGRGFLISSFFPVLIFFCSLLFLFQGRDGVISVITSWLSDSNVTKEIVKAVIGLFIAYLFSYLVYGVIPIVLDLYQGQVKLFFIKKWLTVRQIKKYKKEESVKDEAQRKRDAAEWCKRGFGNAYTEEPLPSEEKLKREIEELRTYFKDVEEKIKNKNKGTIKQKKLTDSLTMLYSIASKKEKTSVKLEQLSLENLPEYIKKKTHYDNSQQLLVVQGVMSEEEKDKLLSLSQEEQYKSAIKALFMRKQQTSELINQVKKIAENKKINEMINIFEIEANSEWLDAVNEIYQYPDEKYIQATKFGTIMMNINTYPKSRYGIDMTCLWPRLLHVVSKEEKYFEKINDAKIYLDFTVIMSFFSLSIALIALFFYLPYSLWKYYSEPFIIRGGIVLILGFVSFYVFYYLSVGAAKVFGEMMKSSVDLFRRKLLEELNIEESQLSTLEKEKEIWKKVSNLIIRSSVKEDIRYKKKEK